MGKITNLNIWYKIKSKLINNLSTEYIITNTNVLKEKNVEYSKKYFEEKIDIHRKVKVELRSDNQKAFLKVGGYAHIFKPENSNVCNITMDDWYVKYVYIKRYMFGLRKRIEEIYVNDYYLIYSDSDENSVLSNKQKERRDAKLIRIVDRINRDILLNIEEISNTLVEGVRDQIYKANMHRK